jgi:hypothetical protein
MLLTSCVRDVQTRRELRDLSCAGADAGGARIPWWRCLVCLVLQKLIV